MGRGNFLKRELRHATTRSPFGDACRPTRNYSVLKMNDEAARFSMMRARCRRRDAMRTVRPMCGSQSAIRVAAESNIGLKL